MEPRYTLDGLAAETGVKPNTILWYRKLRAISPSVLPPGGNRRSPFRWHDGHVREIREKEDSLRTRTDYAGCAEPDAELDAPELDTG